MSRETFVMRNGVLVSKSEAEPFDGSPYVVRDTMDPTWHPANGQTYDSKAAFRQATRAAGCIEVGNEALPTRREPQRLNRRQRAQDIKRSIYELKNGRR